MEKKDWDLTGEVREMAKKAQLHEICSEELWSILETTESVWFLSAFSPAFWESCQKQKEL